ncbi:HD domain-containing protein [Alteribacter natronophilus]|uniref:HD domain-containing protein n=1 Tax=Alteribacter natronophilus TaxID=2583810 RepID=UPI00110D452E|nr:HD domain-containing protein [Alteribacter natronophilus]TMW70150.1 HD domain-containing protein [Alteribacter natronophilus]
MIVHDPIYGKTEIKGVLEDLIQSSAIQRLKKIRQAGAPACFKTEWNVSRYDHSIGVMLLVRRLGAGLEEQAAALLHDIGHTALSHFVDVVYERGDEDYHEQLAGELVANTEIPDILRSHGFTPDLILNVNSDRYPLLEQPLPHLCADRIDYTLRDQHLYFGVPLARVEAFLGSLRVSESGLIYADTEEQAEWFTACFYDEVAGFFMEPFNIYANQLLKPLVREAMEEGIIEKRDWLSTDGAFLDQLATYPPAKEVMEQLENPPALKKCPTDAADLVHRVKPRIIDPDVLYKGEIVPLSRVSGACRKRNLQASGLFEQGIRVQER